MSSEAHNRQYDEMKERVQVLEGALEDALGLITGDIGGSAQRDGIIAEAQAALITPAEAPIEARPDPLGAKAGAKGPEVAPIEALGAEVEEAARALCAHTEGRDDVWDDMTADDKAPYFYMARVGLMAVRPAPSPLTVNDVAEMIEETLIRHGVTEFKGTLDDARAILAAMGRDHD